MTEIGGVARELRLAREAAGLTRERMAEQAGLSVSLIDKVERGVVPVSETYVTAATKVLKPYIDVAAVLKRVWGDAQRPRQPTVPDWFEVWKEEVEPHATVLRVYQALLVPGLLQTEDYARALLADEARVAVRLERQLVLARERPPEYVTIINETVLSTPVGDAQVMYEQLHRLTRTPASVRVHILPVGAETYRGLDGSFELATFDGRMIAYTEGALWGSVLDGAAAAKLLLAARERWEALMSEALPVRQSREVIVKAAERWKSESG